MINNTGMYQGYSVEGMAEVKVTPSDNVNSSCTNVCNDITSMKGCTLNPVYECPQERCIHKQIIHEVPHICPVNTKIINHHIYRHTYSPCYTCTEENEICNVNECPGKFM